MKRVPWFVWVAALAVLSTVIGIQWDIAWHRSVGRDTFWSPPHMAIYAGGVAAGLMASVLVFGMTFGSVTVAGGGSATVKVWGFRGPLGAFIAAWGGVAMLASAPFDDWWHSAYGLDVKILSPPHTVLALGIFAVLLGSMLLILGWRNRSPTRAASVFFVVAAGLLLVAIMTFELELIWRGAQHSGTFYRAVMCITPLVLVAFGAASGLRFGATAVAAVYTVAWLGFLWVLPLVHATPKLGPVYHPVTHLIPAGFPLLLVVPALAYDLVAPRLAKWSAWVAGPVAGVIFLGVFAAVQWPFASFLMMPASRTWVFGSHYFDYNTRPESINAQNLFFDLDGSPDAARLQWALALLLAMVAAGLGLRLGQWLRAVRR